MNVKALTIQQPYASLIADGEKWVENRTWTNIYRGQLMIHAGKKSRYITPKQLVNYTTGAILAVATLVDILHINTIRRLAKNEPDLEFDGFFIRDIVEHEHTEGPYCWLLKDVEKIEPVECFGKQSLWTPSSIVYQTVQERIKKSE